MKSNSLNACNVNQAGSQALQNWIIYIFSKSHVKTTILINNQRENMLLEIMIVIFYKYLYSQDITSAITIFLVIVGIFNKMYA